MSTPEILHIDQPDLDEPGPRAALVHAVALATAAAYLPGFREDGGAVLRSSAVLSPAEWARAGAIADKLIEQARS